MEKGAQVARQVHATIEGKRENNYCTQEKYWVSSQDIQVKLDRQVQVSKRSIRGCQYINTRNHPGRVLYIISGQFIFETYDNDMYRGLNTTQYNGHIMGKYAYPKKMVGNKVTG